MRFPWILLIPMLALVSACGTLPRTGGYYEDDGPEANPPPDIASIPDAVPRTEPRSASGNKPYVVYGTLYTPVVDARGYRERGIASWYGKKFHGKRTSNGETYDMYAMTAAHKTLPLPSYVRVRNLQNGRTVVVRVNDRGPFLHNRLIDLSYAAAVRLDILGNGTGLVEVETVSPDTPATQTAQVKTFPLQIISPAVAAEPIPETPATVNPPQIFLQVGAFSQWDNAVSLRERLERESLGNISIQTVPRDADKTSEPNLYRVRLGPLSSVEEGDRLNERVGKLGVTNARIVIE